MSEKLNAAAKKMIQNLEQKTSKTFDEWLIIARSSGFSKTKEIINYLKSEHGLTHGYANLIALSSSKSLNSATASSDDLVEAQYASSKASLRPIYDALIDKVQSFGNDVELSPKKAYVSLRRNKQFALIQPSTKTRVDVGINLKDKEVVGKLEPSGSFNSMVSHRVRVESLDDVNDELIGWLKEAYEAA